MVLSLASGPPALALHGKAGQLGAARAPPGRKKKEGGKKKRGERRELEKAALNKQSHKEHDRRHGSEQTEKQIVRGMRDFQRGVSGEAAPTGGGGVAAGVSSRLPLFGAERLQEQRDFRPAGTGGRQLELVSFFPPFFLRRLHRMGLGCAAFRVARGARRMGGAPGQGLEVVRLFAGQKERA